MNETFSKYLSSKNKSKFQTHSLGNFYHSEGAQYLYCLGKAPQTYQEFSFEIAVELQKKIKQHFLSKTLTSSRLVV